MKLNEVKPIMIKYDESISSENQQYVTITKIIVPTQQDKEQLLEAFKYIHDLECIDTDYMAVNSIAHIYEHPDLIEVVNS